MTVADPTMQPLLLHVFPSFAVGGAQMRMIQIANRFGPALRHAIIGLDGDTSCRTYLDKGLDVTLFPAPPSNTALPRRLLAIRRAIRTIAPDLLITSNWGAIEWALANRTRLTRHIHTEDGFGPEEHDRQLARRVLTRRIALAGCTVIVPSRMLEKIALSEWRLPRHRLLAVPNGVDLSRFHPAPQLTASVPVIGCVAALRPEKNVARLLRATRLVAEQRPVRLLIIGDGPERPTLQTLARDLGLDVRFAGAVVDPAPYYREMDLFCLSSDTEQMPISVLEAMASGLPIVATQVGDIADMIASENRRFLTERSDSALAAAITSMLADQALRQTLGTANRTRAQAEFDEAGMAARWRIIFDTVLA